MTDDLERRLRSELRASRLPDAPGTLRTFLEQLPVPADATASTTSVSRMIWFLPATVAAVVLGLLFSALPATIRSPASSGPPASTPPASTHAAGTTELTWATQPFKPGALLRSITAVEGRVIITGSDGGAAAWYSDDGGETWQDAVVESNPKDLDPTLGPIAQLGSRLISLGSASNVQVGPDGDVRGAVWISDDNGATWRPEAPDTAPAISGEITTGGPGVVAVGNRFQGDSAEAWTSPDGKVWSQAQSDPSFKDAVMTSVTSFPDGLVAVGYRLTNDPAPNSQHSAAWFSSDGVHWQLWDTTPPGPGGLGAVTDVTAVDGGVLAVGYDLPDIEPMVWRSQRGTDWSVEGLQPGAGRIPQATATGDLGRVIVGQKPRPGLPSTRLWFLPHGSTDALSSKDLELSVGDITALQDRFVAIATCGPTADCASETIVIGKTLLATASASPSPASSPSLRATQPAVVSRWEAVAVPQTTATNGRRFVGPGGGITALPGGGFIDFVVDAPTRARVFRSPDGRSWREIGSVSGSDAGGITGPIAFDGSRYVAVGYEIGGEDYASQFNAAAWVSADLQTWHKAPVQTSFAGTAISDIAANQGRFVGIGTSQGMVASVWTSGDGLQWEPVTDPLTLPADAGLEPTAVESVSGRFVLVGRIGDRPAVLTSADGRRWSKVTDVPGGGSSLQGLVNGPSGLLSIAVAGDSIDIAPGVTESHFGAWTSSSGEHWNARPTDPSLLALQPSIAGTDRDYLVAGYDGPQLRPVIWTSADATHWARQTIYEMNGSTSVRLISDGSRVLIAADRDDGELVLLTDH
jgi:hypothetical protein